MTGPASTPWEAIATIFNEMSDAMSGLTDAFRHMGSAIDPKGVSSSDMAEYYDLDGHSCTCFISAPCSHCTDCEVCNCTKCEDWHRTSEGEVCPYYCEVCDDKHNCEHDHDPTEDGICPHKIQVSSQLTQGDLEDIYLDTPGAVGEKLAAVAQEVARDVSLLAMRAALDNPLSGPHLAIWPAVSDDYEIADRKP